MGAIVYHYWNIAPLALKTHALSAILIQLELREIFAKPARIPLLMNLKIITVVPKPTIVLNARQKALNVIYVRLDTSLIKIVRLQRLAFLVPTPAQVASQVPIAINVLIQ
ncbi:unnamed protein product [Blepharisma stoltei]|uniref:Uncharacterized protein n=1 Tax=Blepharisma stoltei TaxID=1481888 RepID=A0AAU9JZN0_9CILI|nr:unnamed protein product [Blepharisma stoltei]